MNSFVNQKVTRYSTYSTCKLNPTCFRTFSLLVEMLNIYWQWLHITSIKGQPALLQTTTTHDDVMKWKHFPQYQPEQHSVSHRSYRRCYAAKSYVWLLHYSLHVNLNLPICTVLCFCSFSATKYCTNILLLDGMHWVCCLKTHMTCMVCIDGLVQERRNSSALAMELRLSCTNPSICYLLPMPLAVYLCLYPHQYPLG